jgi:hypothetical protein
MSGTLSSSLTRKDYRNIPLVVSFAETGNPARLSAQLIGIRRKIKISFCQIEASKKLKKQATSISYTFVLFNARVASIGDD